MADKTLALDIVASDNASKVLDKVAASVDRQAKAMEDAGEHADRYGKHVETAAEGADKSEQKILGLKDAVDGVATIMQGPGEQGIAAYLQGWADLASGLANFVIPALGSVRLSTIKGTAATVASTVQQKIAAAASKTWAAAQAALNAVMAGNPIALTVLAIAALVAVIVVAYQRSATFRGIVDGLWSAFKQLVGFLAGAVLKVIAAMIDTFGRFAGAIGGIISHIPGMEGIGRAIQNAGQDARNAAASVRGLADSLNRTPTLKEIQVNYRINVFGKPPPETANGVGRTRARGGPVNAGEWYVVGEEGPEIVVPREDATVINARDSARLIAGAGRGFGGGGSTSVVVVHQHIAGHVVTEQDLVRMVDSTRAGMVRSGAYRPVTA